MLVLGCSLKANLSELQKQTLTHDLGNIVEPLDLKLTKKGALGNDKALIQSAKKFYFVKGRQENYTKNVL